MTLLAWDLPRAMGAEVLEECEFEPFFHRAGRQAGRQKGSDLRLLWLGGSYMQDWEARVKDAGATLVADGVLALGAPDDEAIGQAGGSRQAALPNKAEATQKTAFQFSEGQFFSEALAL